MLISGIAGELSTLVIIVISICFIGEISVETSALLESIAIYSVIGGVGVQFLASIYSTIIAFRLLWKKLLIYRTRDFINAGTAHEFRKITSPRQIST